MLLIYVMYLEDILGANVVTLIVLVLYCDLQTGTPLNFSTALLYNIRWVAILKEKLLDLVQASLSTRICIAPHVKCHVNEEIPDLPFQCNLIRKCKDFVDRQLWQSIEIKYRQPRINIQLMGTSEHNLDWGIIS